MSQIGTCFNFDGSARLRKPYHEFINVASEDRYNDIQMKNQQIRNIQDPSLILPWCELSLAQQKQYKSRSKSLYYSDNLEDSDLLSKSDTVSLAFQSRVNNAESDWITPLCFYEEMSSTDKYSKKRVVVCHDPQDKLI